MASPPPVSHILELLQALVEPTFREVLPLQEPRRQLILSHPKQTFQYGATDRHKLDIYYPTSPFLPGAPTFTRTPILFYIYGGGFIAGERQLPAPADLFYANLGAYFASQGFLVVIPDYRLAPDFQYPSALEDVRDAVTWAVNHPAELIFPGRVEGFVPPKPDTENLFILAPSSGASHAASLFLHPTLLLSPPSPSIRSKVAGLALFAGPFHLEIPNHNMDVLCQYHWGSMENTHANCSMALLRRLRTSDVRNYLPPNLLLLEAERDIPWIKVAREDFQKEIVSQLEQKGSSAGALASGNSREMLTVDAIQFLEAKGHDHSSPAFALGTGERDQWAEAIRDWAGSILRKKLDNANV